MNRLRIFAGLFGSEDGAGQKAGAEHARYYTLEHSKLAQFLTCFLVSAVPVVGSRISTSLFFLLKLNMSTIEPVVASNEPSPIRWVTAFLPVPVVSQLSSMNCGIEACVISTWLT